MKLPFGIQFMVFLLWGWQGDLVWLGAALGVLLEVVAHSPWRWRPETDSLHHVLIWLTRASIVLAISLVIYLLNNKQQYNSSMPLIQWLPLCALPLVLALLSSDSEQTDLAVFMYALGEPGGTPNLMQKANLGYPWLALCLLSSSMVSTRGGNLLFYLFFCVCAAYGLWYKRPRPQAFGRWGIAFCLAVALGAGIHFSLTQLQQKIEEWTLSWLSKRNNDDTISSQTAMGHIGELKLGNSIRLQVTPTNPLGKPRTLLEPLLLMQASFNVYQDASWKLIGSNSFVDLQQEILGNDTGFRWNLVTSSQTPAERLEISASSDFNHQLLLLPQGARKIESGKNNIVRVSRNPVGSTQGFMAVGNYRYQVHYLPNSTMVEAEPVARDLQLPSKERALLLQIAEQLQLAGKTPEQQLALVRNYFASNFRYSTWRNGVAPGKSVLADFLQRDHSGHCEHFATASALLLRAAGLPTRYVVGYSVQEPAHFGPGYIVRQRDAHAWARVYVNHQWQDFDATPSSWLAQEETSRWEWVQDFFYNLREQWHRFEWQRSHLVIFALLLVGVLVVPRWLGKRQYRQKSQRQAQQIVAASYTLGVVDDILQLFATLGLARAPHESLQQWHARIAPQLPPAAAEQLLALILMYYQARFGPPEQADHASWQQAGQAWIAAWPAERLGPVLSPSPSTMETHHA